MGNVFRPRSLSDPNSTCSASSNSDPFGSGRHIASSPSPRCQDSSLVIHKIGEHPVGFGGYSDVWKATMITESGQIKLVALKVLRPIHSDADRCSKRLKREVLCWKLLHHENIAPFYGVNYQSNGSPGLVSPWYGNGSADVYLRKHPDVNPLQIIWEIVLGVEYLHGIGVVHGDLKGANVMIDDDGHAKLIDFGLSRIIDFEAGLTTSTTSSNRWSAPELFDLGDVRTTKATDVYAFASTTLELLTGHVPYDTLGERAVPFTVIQGVRPRTLSSALRCDIPCSNGLLDLLDMCWEECTRRPSIREVRLSLSEFYVPDDPICSTCAV